jgi:two-component system, NarL family, response regulator LiaR
MELVMEGQLIRLMIVDDHAMVRKGMTAFLNEYEGISVIGEAVGGSDAIQHIDQLNPDIVIIDLLMPGMDGIETIRKIIDIRPEQRIIVLTAYGKEDKLFQAVKAGAMGYLIKTDSPEELVDAIRSVYIGVPALNDQILWRVLSQKEGVGPHEKINDLSEREIEVLQLLAKGYTDNEIAEQLCLTNVTVRSHVSRVLSKLNVKNRVEATLYGLRSGLVTLETVHDPNRQLY